MDVSIKPIHTEKIAKLQDKAEKAIRRQEELTSQGGKPKKKVGEKEQNPKYLFIVNKEANKIQIKNIIEKTYDVKVTNVNTVRYAGKRKERYTTRGLVKGKTRSFKKAYVTLLKGEKIDIFNN